MDLKNLIPYNLKYSLETLAKQVEAIKSDIKVGKEYLLHKVEKESLDIK